MCLDIDDTLVDFTNAGRRALAALLGRDDLWAEWERTTDSHVARVVAGELEYAHMHHQRTRTFLGDLGIALDTASVTDFELRRRTLQRAGWRLFDDVLPCLDWLRAAGVRLAAVTNASGAHQRGKLADLGLTRFFDHVAIAGEIGLAKPDPRMFTTVCLALGCDPTEAVHIGDKLDIDAIGARDAGLGAIWLDRADNPTDPETTPRDVHVISALDQLPQLLVTEYARVGVPAPR
ncbi:HAD family hydrolase [Amycolatopsis antarctica]|uniref:HAD family hydrolase n=1 Tax=Amycolatopsis antarctica TaxID=1854586 RepID=A0A263D7B1_9PSEU|nr:HAD family hydrolase [Amycolatopsis antarctica]OZM74059.1 HAD family hydrolase [Amycolatopsis antarctica]